MADIKRIILLIILYPLLLDKYIKIEYHNPLYTAMIDSYKIMIIIYMVSYFTPLSANDIWDMIFLF